MVLGLLWKEGTGGAQQPVPPTTSLHSQGQELARVSTHVPTPTQISPGDG